MLRLRNALAAPAGFLALLAIVYWKLIAAPARYVWFDHYDLCQLLIPRLQFFARSIHTGHLPLWDPHIWAGQPVLGYGQPGLLNPLNLIFATFFPLVGGELSFLALNWMFLVIHFLGALACYWFCRKLPLPVLPSMLGGLAFACTGFLGSAPWFNIAAAAAVTPLVFLFAFRLWEGEGVIRSAVPLGVILGASWLTGHHEVPLITAYAVLFGSAAAILPRAWKRDRAAWTILAGTALAFALAIAVSAVQTLPLYEFGHQARRWVGLPEPVAWNVRVPYEVDAQYSLPWSGLASFAVPSETPETHWTHYTGVAVAALALMALFQRWSLRGVRALAWLGLASILYALGAHTPFHRVLYELLPMLEKARTPVRGLFLAGFAISALAAVGAHALISRQISRRNMLWIAALAAVPVFSHAATLPIELRSAAQPHYVAAGIAAALILSLLIWTSARRIAPYALIALVLVDAFTVSIYRIADLQSDHAVCAPALNEYRGLAQSLGNDPSRGRTASDFNALMTDLGDLYGIDVLQSFVSGAPSNILGLDLNAGPTQAMLGVTHRVAKREPLPDETLVGQFSHGVNLFRVSGALPRARIFHAAPGCSGNDSAALSQPDTDTVVVRANLQCPGLLIVSDTFYPGWRSDVDGRPKPILEVLGALRGVALEAGSHTVELRYQPASVRWGAAISLAGLAASGLLMLQGFRRTRKKTSTPAGWVP